eukprot:gene2424-biopygen1310
MYARPVYKSNLRSLYDFPIYKITPPPSYYPRQSGRGVGTIIKRAAPVMKRILKLIAPKIGIAAMRVALPVIKEHGDKALKRIAAGENVKKVTKEMEKSFLRGIKRTAADEVVNVMNKDLLNDVKKQATEELVNTMKGIFVPNIAIKREKVSHKRRRSQTTLNASKQTVVFDIAAQSDRIIDLNHSYFISTLSIKEADGTDIGKKTGDFVGVINIIGQSLWKQIELLLNDTPVTESNGMYAYQSYLETILTYDETRAKNYLKMANWVSDTPGKESAGYPTTDSTKNPGLNESVKLPPFWPIDPVVWFAQVEALFSTRCITTQTTKFSFVISSLPPEIAQKIRDLLIQPPADEPYEHLKTELIKRASASEQKRSHQLLISEELGETKPSQLLQRMRQLLGDSHLEDKLFRQLFLQHVPTNAQLILALSADNVSIEQLASLADKILEVALPGNSVSAMLTTVAPTPSRDIQNLQAQISALTTQMQCLVQQMSHPRGRSKSSSRSPCHPSAFCNGPGQCWYHWKFGLQAQKCNPPCSFAATPQTPASENFNASD